jgi:peptidoglycan hydrolase CwlO-like protein
MRKFTLLPLILLLLAGSCTTTGVAGLAKEDYVVKLAKDVEALKAEVAALKEELAALHTQVAELEKLRAEVANTRKEAEKVATMAADLEKRIQGLTDEIIKKIEDILMNYGNTKPGGK